MCKNVSFGSLLTEREREKFFFPKWYVVSFGLRITTIEGEKNSNRDLWKKYFVQNFHNKEIKF